MIRHILTSALLVAGFLSSGASLAGSITFHSEKDFDGASAKFDESVADLSRAQPPVSPMSLRIMLGSGFPPMGWLLCTEPDYQGDCLWMRGGSIRDLEPWGFGRRIRSVKFVRLVLDDPYEGLATRSEDIFLLHNVPTDKSRRKDNMRAGARITADVPDLLAYGVHDLPIAAVIHAGSLAWQLCTETNYAGRCLTTVDDVDDMAAVFSTHIRSARRLNVRATE
jgi:hypothetical protein